MKGMVANSLGNREEAGAYEFESLQHVCGDTEKEAISHNNLCDTYRSLGHYADAESEGLRAYRLWPSHAGIVCNFALALAKNRKKREAAQILGTLIADSDMGDPRSIVVAHVRHEQELQEILSLLADAYDHSDE
jgi:tetratricopeptide (TPR) repeat protein